MESKKSEEEIKYINTLLNIEQFSGESSTRLGPALTFLTVAFGPILIYVYFSLTLIPAKIWVPIALLWIIRSAMLTLGQEKKRVEQYKQQLYDEYSSITDFMDIKTIHKDGLIEYKNNRVTYLLVSQNSGNFDVIQRAQQIAKILDRISGDYTIDMRSQNILDADNLHSRYDGVALFEDREAAKDYLEIIDFNREIIKKDTLVSRVVFVINGKKSQFKAMRRDIESVLNSPEIRAFRSVTLADFEVANEVVSRDIDSYIDFKEIQRQQYSKGEYYGSYVDEYDFEKVKQVKGKVKEERGFIRK